MFSGRAINDTISGRSSTGDWLAKPARRAISDRLRRGIDHC
jgi:hypothetical protein